jgi:hypothetical protein
MLALVLAISSIFLSGATEAGSRPVGCPKRLWCGCWLAHDLGITGKRARNLWVARAWAGEGEAAGGPGVDVIMVTRRHVGRVTEIDPRRPGMVKMISGNDGGAVRERWRSTRGVIAWRRLR